MAKILIVDDSAVSRKKLRGILESVGHEIIAEACDGEDAFDKYKTYVPDIVTMDITMPNVDGIMGLKNIRENYPDARVVMVTALGKCDKILESLNAGAKNYVTKPYEENHIIQSIKDVLEYL